MEQLRLHTLVAKAELTIGYGGDPWSCTLNTLDPFVQECWLKKGRDIREGAQKSLVHVEALILVRESQGLNKMDVPGKLLPRNQLEQDEQGTSESGPRLGGN